GRIEAERLTRAERRVVPSRAFDPVDGNHVIGEDLAEARVGDRLIAAGSWDGCWVGDSGEIECGRVGHRILVLALVEAAFAQNLQAQKRNCNTWQEAKPSRSIALAWRDAAPTPEMRRAAPAIRNDPSHGQRPVEPLTKLYRRKKRLPIML